MITSRRYDLDWLRILAFGILIYFHTAIIFIHGGLPMIQNVNTSVGLEIFVDISHQFRLALLFFISGIGVAFAKKRRSNRGFILERSRRLLILRGHQRHHDDVQCRRYPGSESLDPENPVQRSWRCVWHVCFTRRTWSFR